MTDAEMIAALQRLHEAATPGPWESEYALISAMGLIDVNANLVVAARNALPRLLELACGAVSDRVALDRGREERRLNAQRAAERERDALAKRVSELELDLDTQTRSKLAIMDGSVQLGAERDRYLAALKAEACKRAWNGWEHAIAPCNLHVGGITFRVTRKPDGSLAAEEVRNER